MAFFVSRSSLAILGVGLGLASVPHIASSEQYQNSESGRLRWLVRIPSDLNRQAASLRSLFSLTEVPGKVLVWGGTFGKTPRPVHGVGDRVVRVATGDGIGVALDSKGRVRGFDLRNGVERVSDVEAPGRSVDVSVRSGADELVILNESGQIALSQRKDDGTFTPAELLQGAMYRAKARKVRCGVEHCVAITARGEAFSWGSSNSHSQLASETSAQGSHEDTDFYVPRLVQLPDGIRVRDAACGRQHTLFVDENGLLFSVGDDHWAQLGISAEPWLKSHDSVSSVVRKAELVAGLAAHSLAGGGQHSVMLVRDGTVFSFGFNQWGQLGHHNFSSLAPPSPIADFSIRAIAISAGENHTCLIKDTGEMCCIGGNEQGQLGNGNLQPSAVWKKVRFRKKTIKPSFIYSSGNTSAAIVSASQVPTESA